jgi:tyrosine-protein kinase Etk/Wzc
LLRATEKSVELQNINSNILELKSRIIENIKSTKANFYSRRQALNKIVKSYKSSFTGLPQKERDFITLTRNFSVNQEIYTFLLEKKAEYEITKAAIVSPNRVIDNAQIPELPISPKKQLILLIAAILGLTVAVGLLFVREFFRDTITSLDELEKHSKTPVLASITKAKNEGDLATLVVTKSP